MVGISVCVGGGESRAGRSGITARLRWKRAGRRPGDRLERSGSWRGIRRGRHQGKWQGWLDAGRRERERAASGENVNR